MIQSGGPQCPIFITYILIREHIIVVVTNMVQNKQGILALMRAKLFTGQPAES